MDGRGYHRCQKKWQLIFLHVHVDIYTAHKFILTRKSNVISNCKRLKYWATGRASACVVFHMSVCPLPGGLIGIRLWDTVQCHLPRSCSNSAPLGIQIQIWTLRTPEGCSQPSGRIHRDTDVSFCFVLLLMWRVLNTISDPVWMHFFPLSSQPVWSCWVCPGAGDRWNKECRSPHDSLKSKEVHPIS